MNWITSNMDSISLIVSTLSMIIYLVTAIIIFWQLKELKRSFKGNTHESTMNHATGITKLFIENPELSAVWNSKDENEKIDTEDIKKQWTVELLVDFFEHMYIQNDQGNLPYDAWDGWDKHIKNSFRESDYFREFWKQKEEVYSASFRKYVNNEFAKKQVTNDKLNEQTEL